MMPASPEPPVTIPEEFQGMDLGIVCALCTKPFGNTDGAAGMMTMHFMHKHPETVYETPASPTTAKTDQPSGPGGV